MVGASLSLHNDLVQLVLVLVPFYRWDNKGSEIGSHWLKVMQRVRGKDRI